MVLNKLTLVKAGILGPLTSSHVPVPDAGLFPARVVAVMLQRFCAGPALDVVATEAFITVTVLVAAEQLPLTILHWNT